MSTVSNLIFGGKEHRMSSPFGPRKVISTSAGNTSSFHQGTDYSTSGKKLTQYAIADGEILSCGVDSAYGGAKFVWVSYPSLKVKMLHYHLDSIKVTKGQKVTKGTALGTTGKTGKATGIHLHLGVKRLSGGGYIDPEEWSEKEYEKLVSSSSEKKDSSGSSTKYTTGTYKVTKYDLIRVRKGAGTDNEYKKYSELSKSAQALILRISGQKVDGYCRGLSFSVTEIKEGKDGHVWGKTPSGWVAVDCCTKQ